MGYEPFEKEWLDAEERCDAIKSRCDRLRDALEVAVRSLATYGAHPIVEDKARAALGATDDE